MKTFLDIIRDGGIAVLKTDTLYGIVADARNDVAVNKIYDIKKRNPLKPCIVLVASILDIEDLGFRIHDNVHRVCSGYWPGRVSIIIDAPDDINLHYLHRGTGGIAFRIPDDRRLIEILQKTGPLVASSANPESFPPASNIREAMEYFGDQVDYYMDDGECINTQASKVVRVYNDGTIKVLRD